MTHHHVEFRYAHLQNTKGLEDHGWHRLTAFPMTPSAARALVSLVHPDYQTRLVSAEPADLSRVRSDVLATLFDVEEVREKLARPLTPNEDKVALVRSALFTVFENYGGAAPFVRWHAPERGAVLKHDRSCQRGRTVRSVASCSIDDQGAANGDYRWFVLQEMQRRARALEAEVMPKLGITAAFFVHPPRTHTITCTRCSGISSASSVAVDILWGEHVMRREYRL